jgi:hypothetical protein
MKCAFANDIFLGCNSTGVLNPATTGFKFWLNFQQLTMRILEVFKQVLIDKADTLWQLHNINALHNSASTCESRTKLHQKTAKWLSKIMLMLCCPFNTSYYEFKNCVNCWLLNQVLNHIPIVWMIAAGQYVSSQPMVAECGPGLCI